jgi:cytochrome c1
LLNGYTKEDDPNWNAYFPGNMLKMGKPLSDGQVEYSDGSPQTVLQYSRDVAAFLMWTAEPKLETRKRTGLNVMIFLFVFAGLLYFTKKRIWADAH